MNNEPIHINQASFQKAVLQSPVPTLVDFWAPWCGPCRMISPVLDEIAKESGDQFRITKVNADDNPQLIQQYGIRGIPALLYFKDGQLRHQTAGVVGKQEIIKQLQALTAAA